MLFNDPYINSSEHVSAFELQFQHLSPTEQQRRPICVNTSKLIALVSAGQRIQTINLASEEQRTQCSDDFIAIKSVVE